jgi:hypothetical protein
MLKHFVLLSDSRGADLQLLELNRWFRFHDEPIRLGVRHSATSVRGRASGVRGENIRDCGGWARSTGFPEFTFADTTQPRAQAWAASAPEGLGFRAVAMRLRN